MSRLICILACFLLVTAAHAEQIKSLSAKLSLDSGGRVSALEFNDPVTSSIEPALRERVFSWAFAPVLVDGEPRAATLNLGITLGFEEHGDKVLVRIVDASTSLRVLKAGPPRYPKRDLRYQTSGIVVLKLLVAEDGRVLEASAVDATNERFEKAALKAAVNWIYEPLLVEGTPARGEIYIPVRFSAGTSRRSLPLPDLSEYIGVTLNAEAGAMVAEQGGQLLTENVAATL